MLHSFNLFPRPLETDIAFGICVILSRRHFRVRETLDFSARVQGVGVKPDELAALKAAEAKQGSGDDPDIDTYKQVGSKRREYPIVESGRCFLCGPCLCSSCTILHTAVGGLCPGQATSHAPPLEGKQTHLVDQKPADGCDAGAALWNNGRVRAAHAGDAIRGGHLCGRAHAARHLWRSEEAADYRRDARRVRTFAD